MSKYFETYILIDASPEKVFDALTDPAKTRLYMYNCEVNCDWEVGSHMLWIGSVDEIVYGKGHLLEFESNNKLTYTVFDPNSTVEDIPENYLVTRITLEDLEDETLVKISQGDYAKVASGEERFKHAESGWKMVLNGLKELVEIQNSAS